MSNLPKIILSLAAMTAATPMLIDSLSSAHAISGPHISLGSNPLDSAYTSCNGQVDKIVFSNTSSHDFIMTDIIIYNGSVRLNIGVSSSGAPAKFVGGYTSYGADQQTFSLQSGIVIPAGENLYCTDVNYYPEVSITGYYTH